MCMFNIEIDKDYYIEGGAIVLTEEYLANRGKCCGGGCRHCPYDPSFSKGSDELREDVKKNLTESKK
jgi:hypothetical protein